MSVNLVRGLAQLQGLTTVVVTTDPDVATSRVEIMDGVPVHRLPRASRNELTAALGPGRRQMQRYLMELAPDVVHSHDVYGLMVQGLRLPRVFTVHGFIHADTLVSGQPFAHIRSRIWRWFEVAGWADQPHIISISPYVRERLRGLTAATIHDIENPVAEAFFSIDRAEAAGTILSAAVIAPRKNTIALVEALARLVARGVDARLRLAGPVVEAAYAQRLDERVARLGLRDRVQRLGPVPSAVIRQELAGASVFALTSLEENAPMGIAEAMAAGVPVVTSNRCGMPYMVREGESGFLVEPSDVDEITERLGQIISDDALRSRMSTRSRAFAEERFHPVRIARRTREVYERACRRRPRETA